MRKSETKGERPRPPKVVLKSVDMKRKLLIKPKTLEDGKSDQNRKVFIKPDLTLIQRKEKLS